MQLSCDLHCCTGAPAFGWSGIHSWQHPGQESTAQSQLYHKSKLQLKHHPAHLNTNKILFFIHIQMYSNLVTDNDICLIVPSWYLFTEDTLYGLCTSERVTWTRKDLVQMYQTNKPIWSTNQYLFAIHFTRYIDLSQKGIHVAGLKLLIKTPLLLQYSIKQTLVLNPNWRHTYSKKRLKMNNIKQYFA